MIIIFAKPELRNGDSPISIPIPIEIRVFVVEGEGAMILKINFLEIEIWIYYKHFICSSQFLLYSKTATNTYYFIWLLSF